MHCSTLLDPRSEVGIQPLVSLFLGQSTGDRHQAQAPEVVSYRK